MKKSLIIFFIISIFIFSVNAYADDSNLLYHESTTETITDGVTYEKISRLYKSGWKDIYVLTIDVTNENVAFEVIDSQTEYALKKSVEALAKENSVVAAVNGDFFGSGNPTSSMGQVLRNGKIDEAQSYYNSSENKYAGIFLDNYGNAFIDYLKTNFGLYTVATGTLELQGKNKVSTTFTKPVYFDRTAFTTTADLDKRVPGLYKIVVENNVITKISAESETVTVPENGYIIVMNKTTATQKLSNYYVGQSVSFSESSSFVFRPTKTVSEILTGISGGGEILRNGKIISQGLISGPTTLNPRTLIGVNEAKDKIIIMVIDGRRSSVGATHQEAGELLLEYGAYDAIHLDGGGSTTLVVRPEGETDLVVDNNVSEGVQRSVPNAIGIKSTNETGALASFTPYVADDFIISGVPYTFSAKGFDINKNPVSIDTSQIVFTFENENAGTINGNTFTINSAGTYNVIAKYGDITTTFEVTSISEFMFLKPRASKTSLSIGEQTFITASALNKDGFTKDLNPYDITWTVDNADIGYIQDGYFYATGEGIAKATATYKGISATIDIAVGKTSLSLVNFEQTRQLYMAYFPANSGISGGAGVTTSTSIQGNSSLLLSYNFPANVSTNQANYVCFEREPITFNNNASEVAMWVKGDNSTNLLKMVIKGADGAYENVVVTETLNFNDWRYFRVSIPSSLKTPVTLDKIYVAALSTTSAGSGTVYIDDITQLVNRSDGGTLTNSYTDPLYSSNLESTAPASGEEDISVFGQTASKPASNSQTVLQDTVNKMKNNARAILFAGSSSLGTVSTSGVSTVQWDNKYYTTNTSNLSVINLATKSGNMRTESPDQWRWLQSYLYNFSKNNIVINMDKDIWSSSNSLTGTRENELLHKILKNFVLETGKNVIVVSATGNTSYSSVVEGVRYINLNGLSASDATNLSSYKYLRIRATANSMSYQICNVYN